jgi:hypothetical protein
MKQNADSGSYKSYAEFEVSQEKSVNSLAFPKSSGKRPFFLANCIQIN